MTLKWGLIAHLGFFLIPKHLNFCNTVNKILIQDYKELWKANRKPLNDVDVCLFFPDRWWESDVRSLRALAALWTSNAKHRQQSNGKQKTYHGANCVVLHDIVCCRVCCSMVLTCIDTIEVVLVLFCPVRTESHCVTYPGWPLWIHKNKWKKTWSASTLDLVKFDMTQTETVKRPEGCSDIRRAPWKFNNHLKLRLNKGRKWMW